jgi:glucose repression mediator protein
MQQGGIAGGAPPPAAALAAAEAAAARERDERPGGGFKRLIDSDDDYKMPNKKPANGDSRGRHEEHHYRRVSPTERPASPRERPRRNSSELVREAYHPSEAAHHPPTLPAIHAEPEQHLPPMAEAPRDERKEAFEGAARKMEIDDDYNDEAEDEKRAGGSGGRTSPQRGLLNGQAKTEPAS